MIALQILNKVLAVQNIALLENNQLGKEYFLGYEAEYEFLMAHYQKYGNVPDRATFLANFNDFEIVDVGESDRYLVDAIREEHLYYKTVPIVQKVAELLKGNADDAVEYLLSAVPEMRPTYSITGEQLMSSGAKKRYELLMNKKNREEPWFYTTGFQELDNVIHGFNRGEELVVLFARTGQGKSWVLAKMLAHIWQTGFRVGIMTPEMSPDKFGYRVDTLVGNFSNSGLMWADERKVDFEEYKAFVDGVGSREGFIVTTPKDFAKAVTVSKLKQFVTTNKLDVLGIDGISYLTDERGRRGDNKTTALTNISEDLMSLSLELGIPILVVVQSNRGGVRDGESDGTPEIENIRDSDGIAHNATKIISIRQKQDSLELCIKKNRDGAIGGKLTYMWDIDHGVFDYQAGDVEPRRRKKEEDAELTNDTEKQGKRAKRAGGAKDVF